MTNEVILELININKEFLSENGASFKALKNINLKVNKNQCLAIVGESGCGKSTLARIISHFTEASKGRIIFKNNDITSLKKNLKKSYYKDVQMIFQDPLSTFSPRMKIGAYMIEPYLNFAIKGRKEAFNYAIELLEMVGLDKRFINRYPTELSGGQLQRVVIARTIGINPDIIICDECTSALDVSIQHQIITLLMDLQAKKKFSIIFITHDLALAESIGDRICVMNKGEIIETLSTDDICKDAKHYYTKSLLDSVLSVSQIRKNGQKLLVRKNISDIEKTERRCSSEQGDYVCSGIFTDL